MEILFLIIGLLFLVKGAEFLVEGAASLAKKKHISDLAVGLTIVAFGTSAPELVVNVFASIQGHHDIVFGNIIGSNNFNLLIILGISGLITPLVVQSSTVWKEIPISLFAAVLLYFLGNDFFESTNKILSRFDGFILLLCFVIFLFYVYKQLRLTSPKNIINPNLFSNPKIFVYIFLGLLGLVIGGRIVVGSSLDIAREFGVSEKIIGLTIVAAGTSLPELATSVMAAIKKKNDIAVGNIIGSNIFNLFFILGLSSVINPLIYNDNFNLDLYLLILSTLIFFGFMFNGTLKHLDRWQAAILLLIYILYSIYLIKKEV